MYRFTGVVVGDVVSLEIGATVTFPRSGLKSMLSESEPTASTTASMTDSTAFSAALVTAPIKPSRNCVRLSPPRAEDGWMLL